MPEPTTPISDREAILLAIRNELLEYGQEVINMSTDNDRHPMYPYAPVNVHSDPTTNLMSEPNDRRTVYLVEPQPEGTLDYFPANEIRHDFRMTVYGRKHCNMSDPFSRMRTWEGMHAFIEKAVYRNKTLNGTVVDVRVMESAPMIAVGSPLVLVMVPIMASYFRRYGRPLSGAQAY